MSNNAISEMFAREERAKAEMYRSKSASCTYPEGKILWGKMADICEEHAFIFESSAL